MEPEDLGAGDERGTAERGIGGRRVPRTIDPDIDRLVERSFGPGLTAGTAPPTALTHPPSAEELLRRENLGQFIRRRDQFLESASRIYREAAPERFTSPTLNGSRAALQRGENEFRNLMRQYEQNPRALSATDRTAALRLFDQAYGESRRWDQVRNEYWKAFYDSPQGRRLVGAARQRGQFGLSMIQVIDQDIQRGNALRILDFDDRGRPRYVTVDVDHMTPRERNPFHAYRPDNLRLQPRDFNRRWLQQFSHRSPFPMGRYGVPPDDIEEFVQSHQLSRRQRPERGRRRVTRAAGVVATLLMTVLGVNTAQAVAQAAAQYRSLRQRRREAERRERPILPNDIDVYNVGQKIDRMFTRPPLDVNMNLVNQFRRALQTWVSRDYQEGGSGFRQFEMRFQQAREAQDAESLDRLLTEVGHVHMRDLSGLVVGDLARAPSAASHISDAIQATTRLLASREEYERRAQAADQLSEVAPGLILGAVPEWALHPDDLYEVYDHAHDIAIRYRNYIRALDDTLSALDLVSQVNQERFRRLEAAIGQATESGEQ